MAVFSKPEVELAARAIASTVAGAGGGTGSPRHREHCGRHIDELVLVTARGGAGGGAMTLLVRVGDEYGGFTGLTDARLRANAPVLVHDEQSGFGDLDSILLCAGSNVHGR